VVASETEEGERLKLELVKQMTGDESLKGRFMRQDYFTFPRTHKIVLMTNNKPEIRENTVAIWRRILLVPFEVTIPSEEQDKGLIQKLKKECSGILNWAINGLQDWQENGLQVPPEVRYATEDYQEEQDYLEEYLGDNCVIDVRKSVTRTDLVEDYQEWCSKNGERSRVNRKTLFVKIRRIDGVKEGNVSRKRGFKGIGLLRP